MLVQHRRDAIHLIRQNDHALVSGEMAHRWRGVAEQPDRPDIAAVVAIALHDSAWIHADAMPAFDPSAGLPHDFQSLPDARKKDIYATGIENLESIQPYSALLLSLHYAAFIDPTAHLVFHKRERERQERLRASLAVDEKRISRDIDLLRLLDLLALRVCLTPPKSDEQAWPSWVLGPAKWDGVELRTRWMDENTMVFGPFPFESPFEVAIPYLAVTGRRFESEAHWQRRYADGHPRTWVVRMVPA